MTQPNVVPGSPIDYNTSIGGPDPSISIWNLPKDVAGKSIWFDTSHGDDTTALQQQSKLRYANPGSGVKVGTGGVQSSSMIPSSVEDVMAQYAAMSKNNTAEFQALQHSLYDANFFGETANQPPPIWGPATADALSKAIESYYQLSQGAGVAISFKDWIAQAAKDSRAAGTDPASRGAGGSGGGSSAPILTDPDTLLRYAQMAAQAALGRNLTGSQLQKFVDTFHQQQVDSYTQAAGHNGLASQKDDPRSSAIQFVAAQNPTEFKQHQISGYTDAFLNMFLSGADAAPNQNVDPTAVGF